MPAAFSAALHRSRWRRPARCWLAAVLLVLAGCDDPPALPAPGAQGPILIRQWNGDEQRPVVLVAATVRQVGDGFASFELEPVLMRMPYGDGVILIRAPLATYAAGSAQTVQLGGRHPGEVKFAGLLNGQALVGCADRAVLNKAAHSVDLFVIEVAWQGQHWTSPKGQVLGERLVFAGPAKVDQLPAGLAATLAVLPPALEFPELHRDELKRLGASGAGSGQAEPAAQ
jgi:hypothetical protein